MKIGFVGLGKLGLPVALAVESKGHVVRGYDINPQVKKYIKDRSIPFREEGLQPLLDKTNLEVTDSLAELVGWADIVFLPVQTPHQPEYEGVTVMPMERVDFDYSFLIAAIKSVVEAAGTKDVNLAVISTCLPGTYERLIKPLLTPNIHYVYTPQFIAMGTVLDDYLRPEFNLIGYDTPNAAIILEEFYSTINSASCVRTDITTAEGIKVSYNTWITAKTVIANLWGEIADKMGMNFDDIFKAWSLSDKRILSTKYMKAGVGDGGGCHPRDNIAMSHLAREQGLSYDLFDSLMYARETHMDFIGKKALALSQEYELPIVILGKSFKPETDITTGSPSLLMASLLSENDVNFLHFEDLVPHDPAIYVIGTQHKRYNEYKFPSGSVVLDPFRYIEDREGINVIHIGKNNGRNQNSRTVSRQPAVGA